ncbi:MAG: hypothetical protein AAFZ63_25200 [Bacteroidota bacterium]
MAHEVKINCSLFNIKERSPKKGVAKKLSVGSVNTVTNDEEETLAFYDFFRKFIKAFNGEYLSTLGSGRALYIAPKSVKLKSAENIFYGYFQAGRTGLSKSIREKNNPEKEIFPVKPDHVDSRDYFFLIWAPPKSKEGLILIQGFSSEIYSDLFCKLFRRFFNEHTKKQVLNIGKLTPKKYVDHVKKQSKVNKITIRQHRVASDRASQLTGFEFINNDVEVTIQVKGLETFSDKINGFLQSAIIKSGITTYTTPLLEEIGMKDAHLSVEYEYEGKRVTARQDKSFELAPSFYISKDDIKIDPVTKLPTKRSITRYCLKFYKNIIEHELGAS